MRVGRLQGHLAAGHDLGRVVEVVGPALQHQRALHGQALGAAHLRPGDRRTGVQHAMALQAGHQVARPPGADEHRPGGLQARDHLGVGRLHAVVPVERGEQGEVVGVPAGRRAPVDRLGREPLRPQGVGHEVQPGGGDA